MVKLKVAMLGQVKVAKEGDIWKVKQEVRSFILNEMRHKEGTA